MPAPAVGLATRYAMLNVLHYRTKYAIAFALIAAFSGCLGMSLFAFNGFWKQAEAFSRSWGDITMQVDPGSLDAIWERTGSAEVKPSRRLEREAGLFFTNELKAERVISTAYIGGQAYAPRGSWSLAATSLDKARLLASVDLAEGAFPGEGEAVAPVSMRGDLKVGDGITFVFKNSDLILDSLRFRVSGFFLPTSNSSNMLYMSQTQFDGLDEARVNDTFFVFLPQAKGATVFLTAAESSKIHASFRSFLYKLAGGAGQINTGYYTAKQRYDQSRTLIEFFELIISIFLVALVVVAVSTIINVLFITIVDRIRIIGTFMAYGMTRRSAILLLSSELLFFSIVACTVGIFIAFAIVEPVSRIKFTADNWTIALILGGKRNLTIIPATWAVGATYLVGMAIPFAAAVVSIAKMVRGEIVSLLHFAK